MRILVKDFLVAEFDELIRLLEIIWIFWRYTEIMMESIEVSCLSTGSVWNILKKYQFHPYKMQILHKLKEEDYPRRLNFCQRFLNRTLQDPLFRTKISWTDESLFSLNGWINKQNYR